MAKILIIAEKPSVAREIAKVLKCKKTADGYIYNEKYLITWAIGHLLSLKAPDDYDKKFKKWSKDTLPIIPEKLELKPIKNTERQLKIINNIIQSEDIEKIICATDSGREGELIFRNIYNYLKLDISVDRLWISSMTEEAIEDGLNKLKPSSEFDDLYASALTRSEADWLVGINGTRAYTLNYNSLLSVGRVQTPTLYLIVQRDEEISNFKAETYWELDAIYEDFTARYFFENENATKIETKEKAEEIKREIKDKLAIVDSIESEEKYRLAPLLFDLTELQREGNKKYSFSAQKTLKIAQSLYENKKLITYPRTDSRYLSSDMKAILKPQIEILSRYEDYNEFTKFILSKDKLNIGKRIINDEKVSDHHAIIPTNKIVNISSLSNDEAKIYDLIVRRFLSVFYPPYKYTSTKIITKIEKHKFISRGTQVIDLGYTVVENFDNKSRKDNILPLVDKGAEIKLETSKITKKQTRPPKAHTEASLLTAMENAGKLIDDEDLKEAMKDSGLGTAATRASIIERLIEVGYMQRAGKVLESSEKGRKLIKIVPEELKSPETTGRWEKGLNSIRGGEMQREKFMISIEKFTKFIVNEASNKIAVEFKDDKRKINKNNSLGKCTICDGYIFENSKAYFCSNWQSGCKFNIWKNSFEKYGLKNLDKKNVRKLLKDKKVSDLKLINPQNNEDFLAELLISKDEKKLLILRKSKKN